MGAINSGMALTAARLDAAVGAGEQAMKVFAGSVTYGGAAYADIPAVTTTALSFTKYAAASKLRVDMTFRAFATATSTGLRLGVRINGVDYDVALGYFTNANIYIPFSGFAEIAAGLAPGAYTAQARWKMTSGAGVITTSSGVSELDMSVREIGV